jgi:hypothetical protein|tara:strand:- start:1597 stop:1827 length:231 start_codon:yes stop_codon:yes gene_type:complete
VPVLYILRGIGKPGSDECLEALAALAAPPALVRVGWVHARPGQREWYAELDAQPDDVGLGEVRKRRDNLHGVIQPE